MVADPAQEMKTRMRADLRDAMKLARRDDARLIRSLIAALDNAEAPPPDPDARAADQHDFRSGLAEIERAMLGAAQVQAILAAEIEEREHAAAEMDRLGQTDRAAAIRAEAALAKTYTV